METSQHSMENRITKHVPITNIYIDYGWNSRSYHDVRSHTSDGVIDPELNQEEGNGFTGLCFSIRSKGQDTSVVVRNVENKTSLGGKKTDCPYELICGFRRATAILDIYENKQTVPKLPQGHIWVEVRDLDATEARLLNLRENTDRSSLSTPDLVMGIIDLKSKGLTFTQMGEQLNISGPYVGRLGKIASLPMILIEHWRGKKVRLPGVPMTNSGEPIITQFLSMKQMLDVADTVGTDSEKIEVYVAKILGKSVKMASDAKDYAAEEVKKVAIIAATLVQNGVFLPGSLQWSTVIGPGKLGYLVSSGKMSNDPSKSNARLKELWALAKETYEAALKGSQ